MNATADNFFYLNQGEKFLGLKYFLSFVQLKIRRKHIRNIVLKSRIIDGEYIIVKISGGIVK